MPRNMYTVRGISVFRYQHSLLQFAEELHMISNGSMEIFNEKEEGQYRYWFIKRRLKDWTQGFRDSKRYDDAVKELCEAATITWESHMRIIVGL